MVNASQEVLAAEERAFRLISGHRALDLVATLRDRHRDAVECLRTPADLDRWLGLAGLPLETAATRADLNDATCVRETINRLTRSVLAGHAPAARDVDELNEWTRRPPLAPQANATLERRWAADRPVEGALALIAREAVELLTGPDRELIRECAASPNCSRLYLDRSPARRRRWCHMEWCGSRAKMASYRQRRVGGNSAPVSGE